ncbi:MAG: ArsC family transcriptional regulator [Candidatus Dadabacteria bacterium]|nr:MAG: ArsC family transcriptional regulator [Candidatus Dadabacteria bacterium]
MSAISSVVVAPVIMEPAAMASGWPCGSDKILPLCIGLSRMDIIVIGSRKCADTRKAERFFKERGVRPHTRDVRQKPLTPGEIRKIAAQVGGIDAIIDREGKEFEKQNLRYLSVDWVEALQRWPGITRTPIVRCGPRATVGYVPEVWTQWLKNS